MLLISAREIGAPSAGLRMTAGEVELGGKCWLQPRAGGGGSGQPRMRPFTRGMGMLIWKVKGSAHLRPGNSCEACLARWSIDVNSVSRYRFGFSCSPI